MKKAFEKALARPIKVGWHGRPTHEIPLEAVRILQIDTCTQFKRRLVTLLKAENPQALSEIKPAIDRVEKELLFFQ